MLSHMLVLGNVKVLEERLQVDSLDLDGFSVFLEDHVHLSDLIIGHIEVLLSGESSVSDGYWSDRCSWLLLDSVGGESLIDVRAELNVVEHLLWVIGPVFQSKGIKLLESEVEIQHRENRLELSFGNFSSSKLVKIIKELFDSHSLHNDVMLESRFNIAGVICDFNSLLHVSVIDNIKVSCWFLVESRSCISQLTVSNSVVWLWVLWNVFWENVLWSINVSAESEVIDFSNVSPVQVLSNQKLEKILAWWNELELLHNSSELFSCDMAAFSPVIILQLRLDQDSLISNLSSNCRQKTKKGVFFSISEVSSRLRVFNDLSWVRGVSENNVDVICEFSVIYKTVWLFILVQQLLDFGFRKLNIESAKACAELNIIMRIRIYLRLILRQCPF